MMSRRTVETDLFPTFSGMFSHPDLRLTEDIHKNLVLRAAEWWCHARYRKTWCSIEIGRADPLNGGLKAVSLAN
jgi:hypothetical protein